MKINRYFRTLWQLIRISRPANLLIVYGSVLVGGAIAGGSLLAPPIWLAALAATLIAAGANTINDVYDIEIDRINKPQRPLPAGKLTLTQARWAAGVEIAAGLALSFSLSPALGTIALLFSWLLYEYARRWKRSVLVGNLLVSVATGAAFVFGAVAANRPQESLYPALMAFFFHLAREIIKDLEDIQGDRAQNANTLPVKFGPRPAIVLVRSAFAALVITTAVPYLTGKYSFRYMGMILFGVYPFLAYVLYRLRPECSPSELHKFSTLLKLDMGIGLLAIYIR